MEQALKPNRRQIRLLVRMCTLVYFTSYVTRLGILTTISEVIASGMASAEVASLAETLNLICYGGGQIVSGLLGDKIKPQKLIFFGLLVTFGVNLAVGVGVSGVALAILWPLNGFAQAFMWPPMVAILAHCMNAETYNKSVVTISFGSSSATVFMYLICPLIIRTIGLKYVFLMAAGTGIVVAVAWNVVFARNFTYTPVVASKDDLQRPEKKPFGENVIILLAVLIFTIALQGTLRDGVQTWTPSLLIGLHGLDTSSAILSSVVLPVFGFLSISFASFIQRQWIHNESLASALFFGAAALAGGILVLFKETSPILCVIMIAVIIGSAHAINILLVSIVPRSFVKTGRVGFISGLLNCGTYIGSSLAVYIFGTLGNGGNWTAVVLLWTLFAAAGTAFCILFARPWDKYKRIR